MEYLLPCAPKFTVRGWPGVAGCFAAGDSHAEREKGFFAKRVGRKDPPAPRGGRDQKDLAETVKKKPTKPHQGAKTSVK